MVYDTAVQLHNIVRHARPARGTPPVGNVVGTTRAGIPRLMDGQNIGEQAPRPRDAIASRFL